MQSLINYIVDIVGQDWLTENNVSLSLNTRLSDLNFDYVDCGVLEYFLGSKCTIHTAMSLQELISYSGEINPTNHVETE